MQGNFVNYGVMAKLMLRSFVVAGPQLLSGQNETGV